MEININLSEMRKIAIVGSRVPNKTFEQFVKIVYQQLTKDDKIEIISGGAKGIDTFAEKIAQINHWPIHIFRPDYTKYPGKVAPLIRNQTIVDVCDEMFAFPSPESRGTWHVIDLAKKAGKRVYVFE